MEDFGNHYEVATSEMLCFSSSFRNQRMQSRARVYIPSNILPDPNLSNLVHCQTICERFLQWSFFTTLDTLLIHLQRIGPDESSSVKPHRNISTKQHTTHIIVYHQ
jgi:hypothetical protein